MSLQSPLGKVLGHGSAQEGSGHWLAQRLTAIALVPLTLWFAWFVLGLDHGQYEMMLASVGRPVNAILLILTVITLVYHSSLGLRVVIEDYVHGAVKVMTLIIVNFVHVILAVGGIYAIIVVSVGVGQ
jgi:succinate dehydrogenase / fumarate reductase membrane anchor subunit